MGVIYIQIQSCSALLPNFGLILLVCHCGREESKMMAPSPSITFLLPQTVVILLNTCHQQLGISLLKTTTQSQAQLSCQTWFFWLHINKAHFRQENIGCIVQQGIGVKDMSLKICLWSSKDQVYCAQKMLYNTRVRLAGKRNRKTSSFQQLELRCNNQPKPHAEQRWHAKLLIKQNPPHESQEEAAYGFLPEVAAFYWQKKRCHMAYFIRPRGGYSWQTPHTLVAIPPEG